MKGSWIVLGFDVRNFAIKKVNAGCMDVAVINKIKFRAVNIAWNTLLGKKKVLMLF